MTTAILTDFYRHSNTKHGTRHTLLALAAYARPDGPHAVAWPSLPTIAQEARLSVRQVCRCLRALVEAGQIAIASAASPLGTNIYTLYRPWRGVPKRVLDKSRNDFQDKKKERKKAAPTWYPDAAVRNYDLDRACARLGLAPDGFLFRLLHPLEEPPCPGSPSPPPPG